MPKNIVKINQDDDKGTKNNSQPLSGELNANHKKQSRIENIHELSKKIFEQFNFLEQLISDEIKIFINDLSSELSIEDILNRLFNKIKAIFQQLEDNFPNLIAETNALHDLVKQLSLFKEMDPNEAYTKAMQLVPLLSTSVNFDKKIEKKHKKIFLDLFKVLNNTASISAPLHKITLVKLGTLYKLYSQHKDIFRVVEMLAALFVSYTHDVPDTLKYKEVEQENATYGKVLLECSWLEICEKAYQINELDSDKQDFLDSCKNLIMCYEGIVLAAKIVEEKNQNFGEINFPEPPKVSDDVSLNMPSTSLQYQSRAYFCFNDTDFAILQNVIPKDCKNQKPTVCIPEIGGIAFDKFMRECLSNSKDIKETQSEEMKQRTAAIQFLFKIQGIVHQAYSDLINDITGKVFDPHQGYISWNVQPKNFFEKIKRCYEEYLKYEIKTEACTLSGADLVNIFFEKAFIVLNKSWEKKQIEWKESHKIAKSKATLFNKKQLKEVSQLKGQNELNYKQAITKIESFKKIVQHVGSEHIKLFAAPASGHAVYSIPKEQVDDQLLNLIRPMSSNIAGSGALEC